MSMPVSCQSDVCELGDVKQLVNPYKASSVCFTDFGSKAQHYIFQLVNCVSCFFVIIFVCNTFQTLFYCIPQLKSHLDIPFIFFV